MAKSPIPKFTKRDFKYIANVMKSCKPTNDPRPEYSMWGLMVRTMTNALSRTNTNFRNSTFMEACGFFDDNEIPPVMEPQSDTDTGFSTTPIDATPRKR